MIAKSEGLFERSRRVSPGGVHSPVRAFRGVGGTPKFIERAEGPYLYDVDGKRYLDFCMSWGPMLFGHRDPEIEEAVRGALSRGWSYGTAEPYSLELAELMVATLPWVKRVRFVNSGTEAVMSAIRVARGATGRAKVLKFEGCYHGHVDALLVKAGSGLAEMASPDSAGVSPSTAAETIVVPLGNLKLAEQAIQMHAKELAAVIIEPLPANNGLLEQTNEFLHGLARATRAAGAVLIFDEVISGFRVGYGGMAEATGIEPDLVTYGKIIGGGFPVGAYGGRADLMDLVAPQGPVYQAGTLSGNPVAMVAGLAMLKRAHRTNPYGPLLAQTARLAKEVEKMDSTVRVFHRGSLFWIVSGAGRTQEAIRNIGEIPVAHKAAFAKKFHALLDLGVYLAPSAFEVGFLSTAHGPAQIDEFLEAYRKAL
jgi:glutamate-1-semialdehyde 2,1-aminomutase